MVKCMLFLMLLVYLVIFLFDDFIVFLLFEMQMPDVFIRILQTNNLQLSAYSETSNKDVSFIYSDPRLDWIYCNYYIIYNVALSP
jgi:hypothetical protein